MSANAEASSRHFRRLIVLDSCMRCSTWNEATQQARHLPVLIREPCLTGEPMEPRVEVRNFRKPDDRLDFRDHGSIDILKLSDGTFGMLATLKPGWKWSVDEKPLLGNPASCPMSHTGYCVSGEVIIRIPETGQESRITRGDFFAIPPGHDAYVPGDKTCELILFQHPQAAEVLAAA